MTLVDTPGHPGDGVDMAGLTSDASLVVMVVSPIRYADATVAALWKMLASALATAAAATLFPGNPTVAFAIGIVGLAAATIGLAIGS
jgi:hypothetical protein